MQQVCSRGLFTVVATILLRTCIWSGFWDERFSRCTSQRFFNDQKYGTTPQVYSQVYSQVY